MAPRAAATRSQRAATQASQSQPRAGTQRGRARRAPEDDEEEDQEDGEDDDGDVEMEAGGSQGHDGDQDTVRAPLYEGLLIAYVSINL